MNETSSILPPQPQGSAVAVVLDKDGAIVSGRSQGIPLSVYAPDELGALEKVLRLKARLSSAQSGGTIEDLLAQQVFEWSIAFRGNRVTCSSQALSKDVIFNFEDVRKVYRSSEGFFLAEISYTVDGQFKRQVLSGILGEEDSAWFFASLVQLLDLQADGVAKPRVERSVQKTPPAAFKLVESAGGSQVEIQHLTKLLHRILPLVIGSSVLILVGFALLKGGGGEGLLPDLVKWASGDPLWSKVVSYLILSGLLVGALVILKIVFGTLKMRVSRHFFEIKKGFLGVGITRSLAKADMAELELSTWTRVTRHPERHSTSRTQLWRLEIKGRKSITILDDEVQPEDSLWLGQFLSEWFGIPLVKKNLPSRNR